MQTSENENEYLRVLRQILETGTVTGNRTAFSARKIFGPQMRFDLRRGFPLVTTKKVPWRSIVTELLWILRGDTNIRYLLERGNPIWTDWPCRHWLQETGQPIPDQKAAPELWKAETKRFAALVLGDRNFATTWGGCGPVYGHQWRHWPDGKGGEIDQISRLVDGIRKNPNGRRHVVSAWNVADIEEMDVSGLPPCHCLFQFFVADGVLSCQLYQRSCDFFLGVPFNVASYALLTLMVAQVTGNTAGEFVWTGGDTHVYENCVAQAEEQLTRVPRQLPAVRLNPNVQDIFAFDEHGIELVGYDPHPALKAHVAV
ncbi:MAG TPA: thymidylate synthase [Candidatus Paceibacterota bacterium]